MRFGRLLMAIIVIFSLAWLIQGCGQGEKTGQSDEQSAMDEKPSVERSSTVTLSAVVDAIDYDKRTFTLKDETGSSQTFTVRNPSVPLEKLKKGDNVKMTIDEIEVVFVTTPGGEIPSDEDIKAVGTSGTGDENTIKVTNVKQMTSTVESIDIENRIVTLLDADGVPLTLPVQDDVKNFDKVKVGDNVVTKVTQIITVTIEK
jgi:hypothetical protein